MSNIDIDIDDEQIGDDVLNDAAENGLADPELVEEDEALAEMEPAQEPEPEPEISAGKGKLQGAIGPDGQVTFAPTTKKPFGIYAAIEAAKAELLSTGNDCASFVGNLDIWNITEEDVLRHMPPDAAYAVEREARIGNRDQSLMLSSWEGMLSMAVGMRYMTAPSAQIHRSEPGASDAEEIESFKENRRRFGKRLQPGFQWILIVAQKSSGKSYALDYFRAPIEALQERDDRQYKLDHAAWKVAMAKTSKGTKKVEDISFQELHRPYKTMYFAHNPTQAAHLDLAVYNPRGVAIFTDEASSLFTGAGMYAKGGEESFRNYMLQGYDAGSYSEPRKRDPEGNDNSNGVRFHAVPLVAGIQPKRLSQLVADDDESGVMTRLKVFWADRPATKAQILTEEQIFSHDADTAAENEIISEWFRERIQGMASTLMIGETRRAIQLDEEEAKQPQTYLTYPRVLGFSREALVEFVNFSNWYKVSIENSRYGKEEGDFTDRDLDRVIRLAGMLHVYQHQERAEVSDTGAISCFQNTPQEIAAIPISMRTLQRAIVSVLFSAKTRRENFARFTDPETYKEHGAAQAYLDFLVKKYGAEKFNEFMSFKAIRELKSPASCPFMADWKDKKWGSFFKNTLGLKPERIVIDGKQQQAYRLADALINRRAAMPAPPSEDYPEEDDVPTAPATPPAPLIPMTAKAPAKKLGVKAKGPAQD